MSSPDSLHTDTSGSDKRLGRILKNWVGGHSPPHQAGQQVLQKALVQPGRGAAALFFERSYARLNRNLAETRDLLSQIRKVLFTGSLSNLPLDMLSNARSISYHHYPLPGWVLCT